VAGTGHRVSPSRPASPGPAARGAVRAVIVVLCVAGAVAALVAHRSERRLNEIRKLGLTTVERRVSPAERERARLDALDLVPSARLLNPDSDVDVQMAVFLERNEARREARLRELTEREPENIFLWFVRLRNAERLGQPDAAQRAYARARALDPRLPPPR
jgi:predicted Zn-dependent protease